MIGSIRNGFLNSMFRQAVGGNLRRRFVETLSSLSATSSKKTGSEEGKSAINYVNSKKSEIDGGDDQKAESAGEKDLRPMIFMWGKDQPAKGDVPCIILPDCDLVYEETKSDEKKKTRPRQSTRHYFLSNPQTEDKILKYYLNGEPDLKNCSSIFCVYNAGGSTLPSKLLKAKASRVVVLEPSKSGYLKKWQKFASEPGHEERTIVKPYDFNRFNAGRIRDYHNNKGADSLCQLLTKAGAVSAVSEDPRDWWRKDENGRNDPPIRFVGVADPYKEHGLFATLMYTRITRSSIFEFGPIELLIAVTPQQYLDFHPESASETVDDKKRRSPVPKLVRWRARLYRYLFDVDLFAEEPFDSFSPEISTKERLKYERKGMADSVFEKLRIDKDKMHWVSIRPRQCDELETLVSRDYGDQSDGESDSGVDIERRRQFPHLAGFAYMHKTMSRHPGKTKASEFLRNYFHEGDERMEKFAGTRSLDVEQDGPSLSAWLKMYKTLATEGGTKFYNSPLFIEAQEFVDQILCPTGLEPKTGKRRS